MFLDLALNDGSLKNSFDMVYHTLYENEIHIIL